MFSTAAITVFAVIASVAAAPTPLGPGECAPGTGYFQNCNGFIGCCKADVCTLKLSYCPDNTWTGPPKVTTPVNMPPKPFDSSTCPINHWFVCSNGFVGCCTTGDPCTTGSCPPAPVVEKPVKPTKPFDSSTCPINHWFVCSSGFVGCCTNGDPCTTGSCPPASVV